MVLSNIVRGAAGSVVVLVAWAASAEVPHAEVVETLHPCFAELVRRAEALRDDLELAAFLVEDEKGARSCAPWPSGARRRAEWRGVLPRGTFAIVHTHPYTMEGPSRGDATQAALLGMPIYVVSRSAVWVVEPTRKTVPIVRDPRWRTGTVPRRKAGVE